MLPKSLSRYWIIALFSSTAAFAAINASDQATLPLNSVVDGMSYHIGGGIAFEVDDHGNLFAGSPYPNLLPPLRTKVASVGNTEVTASYFTKSVTKTASRAASARAKGSYRFFSAKGKFNKDSYQWALSLDEGVMISIRTFVSLKPHDDALFNPSPTSLPSEDKLRFIDVNGAFGDAFIYGQTLERYFTIFVTISQDMEEFRRRAGADFSASYGKYFSGAAGLSELSSMSSSSTRFSIVKKSNFSPASAKFDQEIAQKGLSANNLKFSELVQVLQSVEAIMVGSSDPSGSLVGITTAGFHNIPGFAVKGPNLTQYTALAASFRDAQRALARAKVIQDLAEGARKAGIGLTSDPFDSSETKESIKKISERLADRVVNLKTIELRRVSNPEVTKLKNEIAELSTAITSAATKRVAVVLSGQRVIGESSEATIPSRNPIPKTISVAVRISCTPAQYADNAIVQIPDGINGHLQLDGTAQGMRPDNVDLTSVANLRQLLPLSLVFSEFRGLTLSNFSVVTPTGATVQSYEVDKADWGLTADGLPVSAKGVPGVGAPSSILLFKRDDGGADKWCFRTRMEIPGTASGVTTVQDILNYLCEPVY